MEEKSHGEKIEVVRENGESTGKDSGQGWIEVRVIQLRPITRAQGKPKITWISKVKENLNEMNLSWLETEKLAIENYNDWVRIIKRYFGIWFILKKKKNCNI